MPFRIRRHSVSRAFLPFLATILLAFSSLVAHAAKNRDLIVVIDVSTSMREIFDKAKEEAKQLTSSAQWGDRVTLITFGRSSRLLERTRIKSSYDMARILSTIDKLEATELDTNLSSAMERGLEEMRQYYQEAPDAERVMMWLSDDKDNPPKDVPNLITFETLKQRKSGQLPDRDWFVFKSPIKTETESDVKWFVDWASRRCKMQLKVAFPTSDLGTVSTTSPEKVVSVRFEPESKAVWGTSFSVVAEAIDQNDKSRTVTIPANPSVIVCSGATWDQKILITLPDRPGNYACKISFVLPSDKLLEITPPQALFNIRVEREIKIAKRDIDSDGADREGNSSSGSGRETAFERKIRAQLIEDLKQQRLEQGTPKEPVEFGPIYSGGEYMQSISLFMNRGIPLDSIHMKTSFELPDKLKLMPSFRISEGKLFVDLYLSAKDFVSTMDGWEVRGTVSFFANEEDVSITPRDIPARFYSKSVEWRWGKQELPVSASSEENKEAIAKVVATVKAFAIKAAKALAALVVLWLAYYLVRRYWFAWTQLVGTLEIVKNPLGRKRMYFNLRSLGKHKKTNSLTIGSSRKADISLPHPSVADLHATITTMKTDSGIIVFVQPLRGKRVLVNNVAYVRQKEIGDQDKVAIGEFVFLYTRPELYRETIVCFSDGRAARGALVSWDIDAPGFEFLPQGAPSVNAKMVIGFPELKTVSFVRKKVRFSFDRFLNGQNGHAGRGVEIIFKDGDLLEGRIVGDSGEWDKRFYVLPKDNEEVGLILVERSAIQNIFPREAVEQSFLHFRRALRMLTGRS